MNTLEELNQQLKVTDATKKELEKKISEKIKIGKKEFIDSIKVRIKQYGVTHTDLKAFLKTKSTKKPAVAKPKKVKVKVTAAAPAPAPAAPAPAAESINLISKFI